MITLYLCLDQRCYTLLRIVGESEPRRQPQLADFAKVTPINRPTFNTFSVKRGVFKSLLLLLQLPLLPPVGVAGRITQPVVFCQLVRICHGKSLLVKHAPHVINPSLSRLPSGFVAVASGCVGSGCRLLTWHKVAYTQVALDENVVRHCLLG